MLHSDWLLVFSKFSLAVSNAAAIRSPQSPSSVPHEGQVTRLSSVEFSGIEMVLLPHFKQRSVVFIVVTRGIRYSFNVIQFCCRCRKIIISVGFHYMVEPIKK